MAWGGGRWREIECPTFPGLESCAHAHMQARTHIRTSFRQRPRILRFPSTQRYGATRRHLGSPAQGQTFMRVCVLYVRISSREQSGTVRSSGDQVAEPVCLEIFKHVLHNLLCEETKGLTSVYAIPTRVLCEIFSSRRVK